jgi:hypothetical protein
MCYSVAESRASSEHPLDRRANGNEGVTGSYSCQSLQSLLRQRLYTDWGELQFADAFRRWRKCLDLHDLRF